MLSPETEGVLGQEYFAERDRQKQNRWTERTLSTPKVLIHIIVMGPLMVFLLYAGYKLAYEATCTPLATVQCQK